MDSALRLAPRQDALSTGLTALTPAWVLLIGIYIHILSSLEREISLPKEPAHGRRACGRWREAGELSRLGRPMPCGAQVTGRATVHRQYWISRPCLAAARARSGDIAG